LTLNYLVLGSVHGRRQKLDFEDLGQCYSRCMYYQSDIITQLMQHYRHYKRQYDTIPMELKHELEQQLLTKITPRCYFDEHFLLLHAQRKQYQSHVDESCCSAF